MEEKYVIVEIIPEAISPDKGNLVQISALKLDGLKLIDRFDYRLNYDLVTNKDILKLISYDQDSFTYLNSTGELLNKFSEWSEDLPVYIFDNRYTNNFLATLLNDKISIASVFDMDYTDDFVELLIKKYNLEPSNYIVDLIYEALIYRSNVNWLLEKYN